MSSSKLGGRVMGLGCAAVALVLATGAAFAQGREKLRIPVGRAAVVASEEDVRTVAIAEPSIADAAVGSARTVVVNAKSPGVTSLVVYNEGGRFTIHDIEVFVPNSDKQVVLHVKVAEVNETAKRELGLDLFFRGPSRDASPGGEFQGGLFNGRVSDPSAPLGIGPNTDGFVSYLRRRGPIELQASWKALIEKGDLRVLASPTLVARSGEKASFLAGGEFPVPVASSAGASVGGGGAVTVTIEWKEFGVKVDFMPAVLEDGSINLKVAPEVSQIDFTNPLTLGGFTIPTVVSRRTSTTVRLNGGEHLVIGGLKQTENLESVRKVPILGDIPLIKYLFRSTRRTQTERELLVIVSPEILQSALDRLPPLPNDLPPQVR